LGCLRKDEVNNWRLRLFNDIKTIKKDKIQQKMSGQPPKDTITPPSQKPTFPSFKQMPKLPHARDPMNQPDPQQFLKQSGLQHFGDHRPGSK
jgi:hypothetical protein